MSVVRFLQKMLDAGLPLDLAMRAAAAFEEETAPAVEAFTPRQARNRRYYEAKRLKTSESVLQASELDELDARSPPPSFPPGPPKSPTPTRDISTRARGADFAAFWAAYPRKVGKPLALKAYDKALVRIPGPDPPAEILAGLHAHLPGWAETEPDLIPHPTTWLNRDGWEDQPTSPRSRSDERPNAKPSPRNERISRMLAGAMAAVDG